MNADVLVLGGGYAGISAAKRLARRPGVRVTLLNPVPDFVERIRLHQYLAGTHTAHRPLRDVLPDAVRIVTATARLIDARHQHVRTDSGDDIGYDHLVYTPGSHTDATDIAGAAEHAVSLGTRAEADRARSRLADLPTGATVTVIGGGLTGIETAAELAETGAVRVRLVTGELGHSLSARARARVRTVFAALGVTVVDRAAVVAITGAEITLADGTVLDTDLAITATAFAPSDLARSSGLEVDAAGALLVDDTLVSTSTPSIVGAGDAVALGTNPLRMSCQAAVPCGVHAAETVLRVLAGREPKPLRRKYVGQALSLGRREALVQLSDLADRPLPSILTGRPAALVKEQVCRSTVRGGQIGPLRTSWTW
ncbi:NAD(P)/FAD-dependent oxidoreductase [Nocardia caishijiensis]|uniref:NADH dehydrogenase FAD-containing subunit n=1 Tax=Nocardia caishijiensis TaxID=184756 RepID=A0ABQ6YP02_9NOCA|nr:FAD-dependent oxidoreductase [Nocardia caishijiensis]KAF0847515.1 NADH dehydrogenase FAD-containing subunit [Nocardia caishijiensis]